MTFKEATDQLLAAGIDLREIAEAVGWSHQYVRAIRAAPGSAGSRSAPPDRVWRGTLAAIARDRATTLLQFAADATYQVAASSPNPDGSGVAEIYLPGDVFYLQLKLGELQPFRDGDKALRERLYEKAERLR